MQNLTKQREISQESFSFITFRLSTKLVPKIRNSQYKDTKICLTQEEETNDNSLPKSSQKPKERNLNEASKDVTKQKQKCKTKENDKTKCFLSF